MNDITRIATDKRRSRAVVYNGMVFVGGQTADDRSQDIRGQTQQTLAKIEKFLAEAGTDKSRLLTAQIWIKDLKADFAGMNEVWDAWTAPGAASTRATAQCEMGAPDVLVEIIVTAAVGKTAA
ncbi:RidA family protein [Pigmentiphaga aceris]|uniref:RidA family protein n=1 Tax=Pigmentiphaga aceris TaxID=1940612 RepID=A0A5C0B2L4_9BURK|nr:RidA family protein [Pigmentiphaga aceris]QEI07430.1 RidA family protein [Pigmentiphaga aceris]